MTARIWDEMVVKNVKSTHTVTHTHTLGERGRSGGGLPAPAPPHIHTQKHSTKEPNVAAMYTAVDILLSQNKARRQPSNSVLHCVHCDNPYCHPGPRTSAAHKRTCPTTRAGSPAAHERTCPTTSYCHGLPQSNMLS